MGTYACPLLTWRDAFPFGGILCELEKFSDFQCFSSDTTMKTC
jgi:hypothetical protein